MGLMALPLQPDPDHAPPWWRAAVLLVGMAVALAAFGVIGAVRHHPAELLVSGAGEPLTYARAAERMIAGAQRRVWVLQYVVRPDENGPVDGLMAALAAAAARGVEVRVVLDRGVLFGTTDRDPKNDDAAAWFTAHGVPLLWDEADRTSHAKVLVVDDAALVGSHNWTRMALIDNREVSVRLSEPRLINELCAMFRVIPGF